MIFDTIVEVGEKMAKRFQFDDEDDDIEDQYQQPSHIDELESMRMAKICSINESR